MTTNKSNAYKFSKTITIVGKTYKLSSIHRFKIMADLKATKLHHDMYSHTFVTSRGNKHAVYYAEG